MIFMNFLLFPAAILLFGFAGTILASYRIISKLWRKHRIPLPETVLLYFVIAYWLGTAAFYILARFRAPATPLLAIFAGGFIYHSQKLLMRNRQSGGKAALFAIIAFLFAGTVVFTGYNTYRMNLEPTIMRYVRPDGVTTRLDNSILLIKDNGPATFGGWMPKKIKNGMTIKKKFVISPNVSKDSKITLRLPIIWKSPGSTEISVNGKVFYAFSQFPRRETREFNIPFPSDDEIEIKFNQVKSELFIFLDTQRFYSRTSINGKTSQAELVVNLLIRLCSKKNVTIRH